MQRCEEQSEQHDHQAAETGQQLMLDQIDPRLELRFQELQVLLGGDVVMDRVEDLGGDPFGLLAVDIGVRQGIGQGKPVSQRRLRSALRNSGRRKADAEPAVSGCTPYPSRSAL
jgi:hypothetical protein